MERKSIITLLLEAIIFIVIIVFGVNYYNDRLEISDQNIRAYKGQVEHLELKNGELIASRDSYILQTKDLEELLGISQKEVRDLKRKLGSSLAYISELESNMRIDTVITVKDTVIYKDKKTEVKFSYHDQWMKFNGTTIFDEDYSKTTLYDLGIDIPLIVGLTDNYKIFVQSDNPYVSFSSIEGVVIDGSKLRPKKTRFGWGLQFGFGVMYDIPNKDIAVGPYGGLGVEINF